MYFDKVFYNEEYKPQSIQLICDKCGEYIEFRYDEDSISKVKPEYCVVINGTKIVCKCGNRCQNGLIEPKSNKGNMQKVSFYQPQQVLNIPKCPTCSSTNVQRISSTAKAIGAVTFGIFSKTARSQFKCNNCGYKW